MSFDKFIQPCKKPTIKNQKMSVIPIHLSQSHPPLASGRTSTYVLSVSIDSVPMDDSGIFILFFLT